jgi:TolA-binding protein
LHWHFWHFVLACTPGALVFWLVSFIEPDPELTKVQQASQLQRRIEVLEAQTSEGPAQQALETQILLLKEEIEALRRSLEEVRAQKVAIADKPPPCTPQSTETARTASSVSEE